MLKSIIYAYNFLHRFISKQFAVLWNKACSTSLNFNSLCNLIHAAYSKLYFWAFISFFFRVSMKYFPTFGQQYHIIVAFWLPLGWWHELFPPKVTRAQVLQRYSKEQSAVHSLFRDDIHRASFNLHVQLSENIMKLCHQMTLFWF